jgi:hypothetical protein
MKVLTILIGLLPVLWIAPARAELPDDMLDRDYQGCVGNATDAKHIAFCGCLREGMSDWDEDTYDKITIGAAAAMSKGPNAPMPDRLDTLIKKCITEVLQ